MATGNRDNAGTVLGSLIHWLTKWEKSASLRWSRLCARMKSEGIESPSGLIMAGKNGLKLRLGDNSRGGSVLVEAVEGNLQSFLEYARSSAVSVTVLAEIRTLVRDSLEREEKRIDELIAAVPKLIDDFRCDVAEEHLEQEAKGTASSGNCRCSHRMADHAGPPSISHHCALCNCPGYNEVTK